MSLRDRRRKAPPITAMCRGVRQRIDDLQQFDDRAGPSVRDDERHRVGMFGTDMDGNGCPVRQILVVNCGNAFSRASHLRQS
jgi:hypothetical protein